ncbi:MAG: pyridoxamine 5'-phosphate oxidase family protein [Myxococcaceae bacterium]|nr:pyridoxamine 5'-phosphate oxidase family protein [Myxococcaceae bacterium]
MANHFAERLFTPAVKDLQSRAGSRRAYARRDGPQGGPPLGPDERDFIEARDSLYLATVSETGWPYVQHRGGPRGFVKVLDDSTLVLPDVRGNKQFISLGNLSKNDRAAFIFMDYPNQTRLKVLGHIEVVGVDALRPVERPALDDRPVERFLKVHVEGSDWNCPQGITPRFTREEVERLAAPLLERLEQAEALLAANGLSLPKRR